MNKLDLVPGTMAATRKPTQPAFGLRATVMLGTLERATSSTHAVCCAHPGCVHVGEWSGDVTVNAARGLQSACVELTYRLPPLCTTHALAAIYRQQLPPHLAATISRALAERGFGPAQATAEIELRAA